MMHDEDNAIARCKGKHGFVRKERACLFPHAACGGAAQTAVVEARMMRESACEEAQADLAEQQAYFYQAQAQADIEKAA
eukprot:1452812-Pleurochrysis_carterae.AAC.1